MYFLVVLQFVCWYILAFLLTLLLPIVVPVLLEGMFIWNDATLIFCFLIEYAVAILVIELREHLVRKAAKWLPQLSRRFIRTLLLGSNVLAYGLCFFTFWKFISFVNQWSVFIFLQAVVLCILIWAFCGVAVPMSAKRYWGWFKTPETEKEKWI
jgi:hypothetical protein